MTGFITWSNFLIQSALEIKHVWVENKVFIGNILNSKSYLLNSVGIFKTPNRLHLVYLSTNAAPTGHVVMWSKACDCLCMFGTQTGTL